MVAPLDRGLVAEAGDGLREAGLIGAGGERALEHLERARLVVALEIDAAERHVGLAVAAALIDGALEADARQLDVADPVVRVPEAAADLAAIAQPERLHEGADRVVELARPRCRRSRR